jgi:hypothetical protein
MSNNLRNELIESGAIVPGFLPTLLRLPEDRKILRLRLLDYGLALQDIQQWREAPEEEKEFNSGVSEEFLEAYENLSERSLERLRVSHD